MKRQITSPKPKGSADTDLSRCGGFSFQTMVDRWLSESGFCCDMFGPPSFKGVYIVTTSVWLSCISDRHPIKALYVGRSRNIARRVLSKYHPYMRLNETQPGGVTLWCKHCDDSVQSEIEAIRALRPLYNVQHNGKAIH